MTEWKLRVTAPGEDAALLSEHLVVKDSVSIGRTPENDVVIADPRISGKHARIERHGDSLLLTDLGSKNGTFLGESQLTPHQPVPIRIGGRFSIEAFQIDLLPGVDDVEGTMARAEPSRNPAAIADDLRIAFAELGGVKPGERLEALKGVLRAGLAGVNSEAARTIAAQVRARFRTGGAAPVADAPGADADIAREEELYKAGTEALRSLSARFAGEGDFGDAKQAEVFAHLIAQALEATFTWLSKSLRGREEFEEQFGADLTMIFSKEKNPIKARSDDPVEIGKFLLDWRHAAGVEERKQAIEEAFKDLTLHQLGLVAGVQGTIEAVLGRLDPKRLLEEARARPGGLAGRLLPMLGLEKRAWRQYILSHGELFQENSKLFNELIYPNIRKGYLASHAGKGGGGGPPGSEPEESARSR
jgi:type VI secretion system FHA domain protein